MKGFIALLMVISLPLMAADTGYRIVHPDGTVEFTDDDTRGGDAIPLQEVPSYQLDALPPGGLPSAPSSNSRQADKEQAAEEGQVVYQSISIISPQQNETVFFDTKGLQVSINVMPRLAKGHQVVVYLDGSEAARGEQTRLNIPQVFRGTHSLKAVVQDGSGATLLSSTPVSFHMRQHSAR